jgi:hypothetical protein
MPLDSTSYLPHDTETEPNLSAQILLKAAHLIRRHGLAKYTQLDARGAMCIHGAISIAATGEKFRNARPEVHAAEQYVYSYMRSIGIELPDECPGIAGWNNKAERTAGEVIALLEGAAALAQAGVGSSPSQAEGEC